MIETHNLLNVASNNLVDNSRATATTKNGGLEFKFEVEESLKKSKKKTSITKHKQKQLKRKQHI
jgi:hypothetical protein